MMKFLTRASLALVMTAGTLMTTAPIVHSQDLQLELGNEGLIIGRSRRDRQQLNDDEEFDRRPRARRGCDPDEALDLARDAGLRRARIVGVTPRRVVVDGRGRRGPERIVFANVRGCPEL